jgi:uncharacterized protein DUF5681
MADDFAANSEITAKPKGKPRGKPFKKGQSGNPSGRPKQVHELVSFARGFSEEGLLKLVELPSIQASSPIYCASVARRKAQDTLFLPAHGLG